MSASWEVSQANQVLVGILHTEVTSIAWAFGLRNLKIPGREDLRQFDPFCCVAGQTYDMARNTICQHALSVGAKFVFMVDSDVIVPSDTIERLIARNLPIISGMYCRRSPPHSVPVAIKNGTWFVPPRLGEVYEVDLVGAGCLLINTDVLKQLPPQEPGSHWFQWTVHKKGIVPDGKALSEDFTFCVHAREHGFDTYLDTSIQCLHVGQAESKLHSYLPSQVYTRT